MRVYKFFYAQYINTRVKMKNYRTYARNVVRLFFLYFLLVFFFFVQRARAATAPAIRV